MHGAERNQMSLKFNADEVISFIPAMAGRLMNKTEVELTCPFCGRPKYGLNRVEGIGHCWNAACPSGGRGFNMWQLYGAVYGLSDSAAIAELKKLTGMNNSDSCQARPDRVVIKAPETEEIASPEMRHKVYTAFLQELTLTEKNRLALMARGFTEERIEQCMFRTFPKRDEINYFDLCKRLMGKGLSLRGIPGFFQCKNGTWSFVQLTKGIIMPTRDYANRIVGLQIRKDDDLRVVDDEGKLEAKCTWFSSKNSNHGCGARSEVHFACDWIWDNQKNQYRPFYDPDKIKVILTEGMMKAEIVNQIQPNTIVLSVPGVDALKHLKNALAAIKEIGINEIALAFDMDYETNKNVFAAMEKVKKLIKDAGLNLWTSPKGADHMRWDTYVEVEMPDGKTVRQSLLKGIDDLMAYRQYGIIPKVVEKVG